MEMDQSHMTERILELTLEIVYLLTGEDYKVVKKISGEPLTLNGCLYGTSPITVLPPHCLTTEGGSAKKILELIKKMIELLTGEVPIRCQDVTVYLSTEEWEYLEGHEELYKEVMMASKPAHTSPDGSSNGNPPERYLHPLYSHRDSTQEDLTVPHHHKCEKVKDIQIEEKMEEETLLSKDQPSMEDSDKIMKSKQEESSLHVDTNGRCARSWNTSEAHCMLSPGYHADGNDVRQCSPEENPVTNNRHDRADSSMDPSHSEDPSHTSLTVTPDIHLQSQSAERSADPSNTKESTHTGERSLTENDHLKQQRIGEMAERPYSCSECGKSFARRRNLLTHQRIHKGERNYSCSECGKSFTRKGNLLVHQRVHTGERPYSCSECGKCFTTKVNLLVHLKIHTGERPFACSHCEKCFIHKASLLSHQRIHTGERPFACSECGKCFAEKRNLLRHQRIHTAVQPFSCSHCGKGFSQKGDLLRHQRGHTGERPFSCPECGKSFIAKVNLHKHQRSHTGERPFPCSECGKCFSSSGNLAVHKRIHTGERPYSCSVCKKSFSTNRNLIRHHKNHKD